MLEITDAQESRTFGLRAAMSFLRLARVRDDLPRGGKAQVIAGAEKRLREVYNSFAGKPDSFEQLASRTLVVRGWIPREGQQSNSPSRFTRGFADY